MEQIASYDEDLDIVESAIEGDASASAKIATLIGDPRLLAMLVSRGASASVADEVVSALAEACFGNEKRRGARYQILTHYSEKGPLAAYLRRVAVNLFLDHVRDPMNSPLPLDPERDVSPTIHDVRLREDAVVALLRQALTRAFGNMNRQEMVILRLVKFHGISQKRVAAMWRWSETKIARRLAAVTRKLREETRAEIHRRDPWLDLEWDDFLALCTGSIDFFDD